VDSTVSDLRRIETRTVDMVSTKIVEPEGTIETCKKSTRTNTKERMEVGDVLKCFYTNATSLNNKLH
jgi:hypothetical protein